MNIKNIITKLKRYNLSGRGGAAFSTGLKWETVKNIKAEKKYIVCNASEGEPNVFKDGFILENYPVEVIEGIKIALKTIDNSSVYFRDKRENKVLPKVSSYFRAKRENKVLPKVSSYIYLRKDYYQKFKRKLEKLIGNLPITLFKKPSGYLAGEETALCEAIEGKRPEPRIKPPFPAQSGIFGYPTLINNVETFYFVAKIAKNKYKNTRFYSLSGDMKHKGVYELPENYSVSQVLKETNNWPNFDFFVQSGGGASGEILLPDELDQKVSGAGAVIVFNREKTNPISLMKKWANFFLNENCDKCVPCREGVFRIVKMIENKKIERKILEDIIFALKETSFCALGKGVAASFESLIKKVYPV